MKLAIDLGGTNIRIGQIEGGSVVRKTGIPCPSQESYSEVLSRIEVLIEQMMTGQVEGIGIGVPSVVDSEKGIVYNVANIPSWKEVHLKAVLQEKFSVPVYVNNDANCFALGEKLFGEGTSFNNVVGLTLGTGVGTGIIINGKLYSGHNTGAGEIGSLPYLKRDFEYYCSSAFFVDNYQISGKEAAERAACNDTFALNIWKDFGVHIGNLMKAILFTYDPEAIIIGGGIATAFPFFVESMKESMSTFPYPETLKRVRIVVSKNENISLLGASALIV
ncbi:ROK family protein [uncultured Bacteroides sp.]|uniref:ROK family protein n=1 Tax=uncultured Bacteroides sp. TaxID=162156 RepID=UPI002AA81CAA|nr:ROK family protein [uncultured Bacteroides sp.]